MLKKTLVKPSAPAAPAEDIPEDRVPVIILTTSYRIRGYITLIPGARITDYLAESRNFIALTQVEVRNDKDETVLSAPFLNVNRDQIHIIVPAETTNKSAWRGHWDTSWQRSGDL